MYGSLIQGNDGGLYGTTGFGGANGAGTIFKISQRGTLTTLHTFCAQSGCTDGAVPYAGLLQTQNGNFYGTTYEGGSALGYGTVFELGSNGLFSILRPFCSETNCADGLWPAEPLIQASNRDLYGVAFSELYQLTPAGVFSNPPVATGIKQMIQATDGNFYGVGTGSTHLYAIIEVTKAGQLLTLYSFCQVKGCPDGTEPTALMQAADGTFYGATSSGGTYDAGTVFQFNSVTGQFRTVYSFCSQFNCADGAVPYAGLIQGTDGNFYGTASGGGTAGAGTVFQITPGGQLTTLHVFCLQGGACSDGADPLGALVQATDGNFYGTTYGSQSQCPKNCGTVFQISTGLRPFVRANPGFAQVGRVVNILGNNLASTTGVSFNGVQAAYRVMSNTYIEAQVPSGATTGMIQVMTTGGTLSSDVAFQVLP